METIERPHLNGNAAGGVRTILLVPKPRRRRLIASAAAVIAIVLALSGVLVYRSQAGGATTYVSVPVTQGDLVQTVSATGTVNPQNTINVGTQQSGTISEVDVDYNSKVHVGQILAKLDPTQLEAQVASARASLTQAQAQAQAARDSATGALANVTTARASAQAATANAEAAQATAASNQAAIAAADANVTKAQAALALANQTVGRDQSLISQGYIPQAQVDNDRSSQVATQSALAGAQVAAQQARSQALASNAQLQASRAQTTSQSAAALAAQDQANAGASTAGASAAAIGIQESAVQQAETNLSHAVITSPVNGTVIARNVAVGVTVAASFQTPTLFSIAQDLSKMEVDLAVGEPDIGNVRAGEGVDFTVLAYPNRTFHGVVAQVRKNPVTTNNVVTYTTVVLIDNPDGALLPGMTANATIDVAKQANALVVPLAALSYAPSGLARRPRTGTPPGPGTPNAQRSGSPWGQTGTASTATVSAGSHGRLFVERNGKAVFVPVDVELVAGTQAAVTVRAGANATLAAGDAVIVGSSGGSASTRRAGPTTSNPFAPAQGGGGAMRGVH